MMITITDLMTGFNTFTLCIWRSCEALIKLWMFVLQVMHWRVWWHDTHHALGQHSPCCYRDGHTPGHSPVQVGLIVCLF